MCLEKFEDINKKLVCIKAYHYENCISYLFQYKFGTKNKRVHCNLSLSAIRLEIIPCKVKVLSYQAERIIIFLRRDLPLKFGYPISL